MKILYLHQYFNTPEMSGGTRSFEMARRLVAKGHQVTMVTSDATGRLGRPGEWVQTEESGIQVWWYGTHYSNSMNSRQRLQAFTRFAMQSARQAARIPTDVIFATSTPLTIAIPALFAKWRQRVPMVFEVRDLWPEVPIAMGALKNPLAIAAARWLERTAYRHSSHIVALSPQMGDGVANQGIPSNRIAMIPNSCDLDLFDVPATLGQEFRQKRPWLGDRPLVVYTGTLGPANGVDYFIRLAAETKTRLPEVRFLIMGSGREEAKLKLLASELGVLNSTLFISQPVNKGEMPAVLSAATIATSLFANLPELQANSPNKLFDALAAGKPVAINNRGWLGNLIEQEGFGLSLSPTDLHQAADDLCAALQQPGWLQSASAAARRIARERFDRDLLANQLEQVLQQAVARRTKVDRDSHSPLAKAA